MATSKHDLDAYVRRKRRSGSAANSSTEAARQLRKHRPRLMAPTSDEPRSALAGVLGAFEDAAVVVSQHADALLTNPAYDALLQRLGGSLSWATLDGTPVPADVTPLMRAARAETVDTEYLLIDAAQTRHPVQVKVRPLAGQPASGAAGCVVVRDLADHHAGQFADRFVELLSHELKAPVTSLQSHAELLVRYLDCDLSAAEARFAMERIHNLSSRLGLMIQDLYELARITSGKLQIRRAPINLHDVVVAAVDTAEALPGMPPIQIVVVGPAPVVSGDATRLSGVVMNLLTNAARHAFTTDGITVRIWSDGGRAAIDVEDHGPGIPPEEITRIFHRHYQVQSGSSEDAANDRESTSLGLGLYIARQIVHAHDGQLMVASELGVGSRFTISIPRR